MATLTPCDKVQIKYKGDGSQKLFTFPFTYIAQGDIYVSLWDDTTKNYKDVASTEWSFANATTIQFNIAPLAPTDPKVFNIRIYRRTFDDKMLAEFYPGSAVRAKDLNDNFEQLRLSIEEGRCSIPGEVYQFLNANYWNKSDEVIDEPEQLTGEWVDGKQNDDKHVATAKAISRRLDTLVQDATPATLPSSQKRQQGKFWVDSNTLQLHYWDQAANAWINVSMTGPTGPQGPKGDVGPYQTLVSAAPPTTRPSGAPIDQGDIWFNTDKGEVFAWYDDGDSKQWVSVTKTGPVGPKGDAGPQGPIGNYQAIVQTSPPTTRTNGDPLLNGDIWFNNGNGETYTWYNDGDSSQWVTLTKPGPAGPPGLNGTNGTAGVMASITGQAPVTATTVGTNVDLTFDPIPLTSLP